MVDDQNLIRNNINYDHGAIYQLLKFGFSYRQIALRLGCCEDTVCNELKRVNPYNLIKAQHDADIKRHRCGRHYALITVEQEKIEDDLRLIWSPEEVVHRLHICTKLIYNCIYHGVINFSVGLLHQIKISAISVNTASGPSSN